METLGKFEAVRDQIKSYLPQYLAKFGIDARDKKRFHCLNPSHQDKHPTNCGIIPGANLWHCFACGMTGDIFDAANAKEGKPLSGRGFVTDNLMYLAKTFGVDMPELNLSDEELFEIDARRAYAQAARIITDSERSAIVAEKIKQYQWPENEISRANIGTVVSYENYIERMTKTHGHSPEFLAKLDLDRRGIFNPKNLIYTIHDEHGSPVAFSARNLKYEEEQANYRNRTEDLENDKDLSDEDRKIKLEDLYKPRKYNNSKDTVLFNKSRTLMGFSEARKSSTHQILVFEGNADRMTMYCGGAKTATATCGTAFTEQHLEMVMTAGITKIILVFDPDAAGERGTERFIEMLETFGGHPGLEVEIIVMPGQSDPDAYVRAFGDLRQGVAEFRKLPKTDLFTWKLKKLIEEGADPITIANDSIPLIVNIENNILRLQKADRLAEATGLPKEFIHRELLRKLDANEMKADEERQAIAQQTIRALQQNPKAAESILAGAAARLEAVDDNNMAYNPQDNLRTYRSTIDKMEAATDMFELVTSFPMFDSLMGGIPKEGAMISVPGKPHHGKSIWFDNLIVNLLENNSDLQIFLHHVDDAALSRIPRFLGIMSGLSSRSISKAGASLVNILGDSFEDAYRKAEEKLTRWIEDERLILADAAKLTGSLPAHERWIKEIRRRNPNGNFLSIGDNFHLFDLPGLEPGEGKMREMSKFISNLSTKHGITTMFSMELPKDILKPGVRPKYTDSKNSGGIAFDSKVNMNVYQELQDLGDESVMVWRDPNHVEQVAMPDGTYEMAEKQLPIVEIIVDKNKVTGVKKTVLYRLEPMSGQMTECTEAEHTIMLQNLEQSKQNRKREVGRSYSSNQRVI